MFSLVALHLGEQLMHRSIKLRLLDLQSAPSAATECRRTSCRYFRTSTSSVVLMPITRCTSASRHAAGAAAPALSMPNSRDNPALSGSRPSYR
jgi:hypothetical protein